MVTQMPEDPKSTENWEREKELQEGQADEDPEETKDWESEK